MKQKEVPAKKLSQAEAQLIGRLRRQPRILARVQSLLEIADSTEGVLKSADQVEERLIEELRLLGNATLSEWATQAEERVNRELRAQDPTVRSRKKKR